MAFSLAAGTAADGRLRTSVLVVVVGFLGLGLGYVVTRTVPLIYIAGLGAVGLLPYAAARLRVPRALFALPVVCVALAPIHRSALAFVPMALVLGAVMPLAIAWVQVGAEARLRRLVAAVVSLTAVAGFAIAALLGWIMLNPADDMRETGPAGWLVETILGATPTKANILAGSGPKVALFELARAVLPSLALFSGILLALGVVARRPAAQGLVAWALAVALGSLLLIGVPFVYRSGFLVITLLIVALVAGWQSLGQGDAGSLRRATMAAAGAYVLLAIPLLYRCGALSRCERSEYLDLARTPLTVLGLLVLAGAAAGALSWRARALALVAPAVVVLLFVLESQVSRAFFMHHSYGEKEFSASRAVSHLSPQEVELAEVVRAMGNHLVVVSDPYTMSNIRALTGLNSLITYSNLDTLSPVGMVRLREWLKETVAPSGGRKSCTPRHPLHILDHTVNTAEFNYWLARSASPEVPASEVLRQFGLRDTFFTTVHPSRKGVPDRFPDHEWRKPLIARLEARFPGEPAILLVVDSKTIRWARGDEDVDYFPDVKPLEHDFVAQLEKRCGARVHDGRFGLIRFPMAGQ